MSEQAEQGFYFVGKHYSTLLKQRLQSLIGDEEPSPQTVEVIMGRKLPVWTYGRSIQKQPTIFYILLKHDFAGSPWSKWLCVFSF